MEVAGHIRPGIPVTLLASTAIIALLSACQGAGGKDAGAAASAPPAWSNSDKGSASGSGY